MAARAYVRVFTDRPERWADLSDGEYRALDVLTCAAAHQWPRGLYRNVDVVRGFLPRLLRKHVRALIRGGFLVEREDETVYVHGWDEDQEGDFTVADRVRRHRASERQKLEDSVTVVTLASDTPETVGTVTPPSEQEQGQEQGQKAGGTVTLPPNSSNGVVPRRLLGNLYTAFEELTGRSCDLRTREWIDDLSRQFGREFVGSVMYDDAHPARGNLMGRVTSRLRSREAV